jgi:hypothetical protein
MQSPELTPSPSTKVLPPNLPTSFSESRISEACDMRARDDVLGESSVTTLPVAPIERLQRPRWPAFVIALALLLTLLWSGTLVWLAYRTCQLLLSALF